MRNLTMRLPVAMLTLLIGLAMNSAGCATKPQASVPDRRPCIIGFLSADDARTLFAQHPHTIEGDAIVTRACLVEDAHDRLLETYRLTNP